MRALPTAALPVPEPGAAGTRLDATARAIADILLEAFDRQHAHRLGRSWSPHIWSNGYGLVANLHAAVALSQHPFVEVPFDPPAWSAERRDWMLPQVVEIDADGTIAPPPGPGLGVEPDLEALERWRVA